MNNTNNIPMNSNYKVKSLYCTPEMVSIELDNEISLVLESNPPNGPNEIAFIPREYFNKDPFKSNLG